MCLHILKIGADPEIIKKFCGKYPTIFISFKDTKATTFEEMKENISDLLQELFKSHRYLLESPKLDAIDKDELKKYITGSLTNPMILKSLKTLSHFLFKHFDQKAFIFIDEYDTPLNDWYALQLARETISSEEDASYNCDVKIPNREVRGVFSGSLQKWIAKKFNIDVKDYNAFLNDLLKGKVDIFAQKLKDYLEISASFFVTGPKNAELFYNGFIMGLISAVSSQYFVDAERGSGNGRADLLLIPKPMRQ